MTEEVKIFLNKLNSDFFPIVEQAKKYFDKDSKIREDGAAEIFRRPWVAPVNYGLWLFPPAVTKLFDKFVERTNVTIPKLYKTLLIELNGCFVYSFSLYGLPTSLYTTGLLDRSNIQQFDLGTANRNWKHQYNIDTNLFYIGGRSYSHSENIGYFIKENKILSIRKSGEILKTWDTILEFLNDEIAISEKQMLEKVPDDIKNSWKV